MIRSKFNDLIRSKFIDKIEGYEFVIYGFFYPLLHVYFGI